MYVEVPVTESDSDVSAGRWHVRMPVRRAGKQPPRNRREEAGDRRGSAGAVPGLGAAEVIRLCVPAASVVRGMEACPPARFILQCLLSACTGPALPWAPEMQQEQGPLLQEERPHGTAAWEGGCCPAVLVLR